MRKDYKYQRITWTDPEGKRHYMTGKTRTEAKQKLKVLMKRWELEHTDCPTLAELTERYIHDVLAIRMKPETLSRETRSLYAAFCNSDLAGKRVDMITHADCQRLIDAQAGKSRYWITATVRRLKNLLKFAVDCGIISEDVSGELSTPKGTRKQRHPLTALQQSVYMDVIAPDPKFLVFNLSYFCGLRPSEARGLQVGDVELTTIDGQRAGLIHVRGTKTAAAKRTVPIPDVFLQQVVDACKGRLRFEPVAQNGDGMPIPETLYVSRFKTLKREMIRAGVPERTVKDLVPYSLRHTYCTNLANSEVDIRTAQYLMGHENISMTANIYTHHGEEKTADDWREVNKKAAENFGDVQKNVQNV